MTTCFLNECSAAAVYGPVAADWTVSNIIDINGHFKYRESMNDKMKVRRV